MLARSTGTGYRAQLYGQILMETLTKRWRCSSKKSGKVFTAGEQKFLLWHLPEFFFLFCFFKCAWREYALKHHTVCKTYKKGADHREPCQSIDTFFLHPREDYLTDKATAAGRTNVCHMVHDESRPPGCRNELVLVIFTLLVLLYIICHILIPPPSLSCEKYEPFLCFLFCFLPPSRRRCFCRHLSVCLVVLCSFDWLLAK